MVPALGVLLGFLALKNLRPSSSARESLSPRRPSGGRSVVTVKRAREPDVAREVSKPEPWPAVVPSWVPPFPGSGWTPDVPERPEVVARAVQLIRPLHAKGGPGKVVEFLGGRWIAFRATHHGAKTAVEAFRLAPSSRLDVKKHREKRPVSVVTPPATVAPVPVVPKVVSVPGPSLPVLKFGSKGPDVTRAQTLLGGIKADGIFGPKTDARTRAFQRDKGLKIDGVIGPKTWGALLT